MTEKSGAEKGKTRGASTVDFLKKPSSTEKKSMGTKTTLGDRGEARTRCQL